MTRSEPFPQSAFPEDEAAVLALARAVRDTGYSFTTVTPASHAHVNARPRNAEAKNLRDVFGWSRPFRAGLLPEPLLRLMREAGAVVEDGPLLRPTIRFSSLDGDLFAHSAYPPSAADAVFFGPDTMRFAHAVIAHLEGRTTPVRRAVDLGCGSGAAGICVAKRAPGAEIVLVDINPAAMRAARINARLAGTEGVAVRRSDMLRDVEGRFDLIVSNPPSTARSEPACRSPWPSRRSNASPRAAASSCSPARPSSRGRIRSATPWPSSAPARASTGPTASSIRTSTVRSWRPRPTTRSSASPSSSSRRRAR
jgi:release factor glutamine methyltransferase